MKNNTLSKVLNKIILVVITLVSNVIVFAQVPPRPNPRGGTGGVGTGQPEKTPIDMYEGILLLVAVSLIIGYYLYKRNRRIA